MGILISMDEHELFDLLFYFVLGKTCDYLYHRPLRAEHRKWVTQTFTRRRLCYLDKIYKDDIRKKQRHNEGPSPDTNQTSSSKGPDSDVSWYDKAFAVANNSTSGKYR